ncbi:MAG: hypothetical protein IKJ69_06620 [Clostridia bacterium]|nr:hypothetical protein [Clostridia bacterium]
MDLVCEVLVEFFAELFCEAFLSASTEIVPYEKLPRKKREKYKFIVAVVSVVLLVLLVIGGIILLETNGNSELGKILIGFPTVYILTAVVLMIKKLRKRKKRNNFNQ